MGIRETLNQNPGITTGVTAGIIVVALALVIWQASGGGESVSSSSKIYYSDDDGKTFFADEVRKITPFDHGGKEAVRAYVYTCDGGKTKFVGYLSRYTADFRARMEKAKGAPGGEAAMMEDAAIGGMEYKKPGDAKWARQMTPEAQRIFDVKCPNGSRENLEQATP